MRIAKFRNKKGQELFAEVLRDGATVQFDSRQGWVLLSHPLDMVPRKRDVLWVHPADERIEWIREFRFLSGPEASHLDHMRPPCAPSISLRTKAR